MARPGKAAIAKRDREREKLAKRREKEARREQRQREKAERPRHDDGTDPDLEGLEPGPQAPLF